ncbi:MAG: bifunctional phosphoribosylaminoimidazolecarboxamide formyltransferase/IMP cyclohydrolase [Saprospiraceae bacterium]|nr:bifunctional phosphoribosylaminoimidazolecarboxamide formyltransferase/IMP cyclohydrolase [Saprospiraceae bacterium]
MELRRIHSALISIFDKNGIDPILKKFHDLDIKIYSTGGTLEYIKKQGYEAESVEDITEFPSILDGRVKTLHPKIFGGLLAKRGFDHRVQLERHDIPEIDCVIVDLYPFENTLTKTDNHEEIIEKIDIGGISLIRAAAKNFFDVVVVPSKNEYTGFLETISKSNGFTNLEQRKWFAGRAFSISAHYDTVIGAYFNKGFEKKDFQISIKSENVLRYGENPHQKAKYFGDLDAVFKNLGGKEISFNNMVDIDAAMSLITEFDANEPTIAILKHTNPCGVASRPTINEAWKDALNCDPQSAFGGIIISNQNIDLATAKEINDIFYEVLIAPSYDEDALTLLTSAKKRSILQYDDIVRPKLQYKSLFSGVIVQDSDNKQVTSNEFSYVTNLQPKPNEVEDLLFANKCVKHLKSNAIAIAKNRQLIGIGTGQTSRVDALNQAILKAQTFHFDLNGSALASDAFFPFADCVGISAKAGITAIIQPGGSIRDQDSIDLCNEQNISMVFTGIRHFKH